MFIKEEYIDELQELGGGSSNNFKVEIKDELKFESGVNQSFQLSLGDVPDKKGSDEMQVAMRFVTTVIQNAKDYTLPDAVENQRIKRKSSEKGPFICDECSVTFTRSYNLITHKKIHTGEKPYKCDFENCKYASIKSSDLTRHKRRHLGGKAYECSLMGCKAAFTRLFGLKRHYNEKHKQTY